MSATVGVAVASESTWDIDTGDADSARHSKARKTVQKNNTGTAKFRGKRWWYCNAYRCKKHNGGMHVNGKLRDKKNNNRGVKFQVKANSLDPKVWNAKTDRNRRIPGTEVYDPHVTITHDSHIQTCQRNYLADDCSSWRKYKNPFYK